MDASEGLADLLLALKERSGLSYSELARRTYTSSSTLHRYCLGKGVPGDYQSVAKIAQECGASDDELHELLLRWRRATGPATERPAEPEPAAEISAVPPDAPVRRRSRLPVAVALAAVLALLAATSSAPRSAPGDPASVQVPTGHPWVNDPSPVPTEFFGVTMNSTSGTMPAFRVGSVRFWDSRTRWANLQPHRDAYDWATLDRLVEGARRAGLPSMFTLGGTPEWAAPNAPKGVYRDSSRSGPPDDLADWDRFVRTLTERYQGRIEAYELWVSATDPKLYAGSVETLVEMTRRAAEIIRSEDGEATVVCPSMGELWQPQGRELLRRFAELGGYDHCDVAGVKLHQRDAADPPETLVGLLADIDDVLHAAGVHPRLWNTGTTYDIQFQGPLDPRRAADHAMRFYLAGLYGREFGLARMYFYNWGSGRLPLVLQAEGSQPTGAALAVAELQRWLADSRSRACGQGSRIGLPENVWQCEFVRDDGKPLTVRWTSGGTARTPAGPGAESTTGVDGQTTPLAPGATVTVTETPTLITYA
ncbi:helix-turn-helix domain-containing protein [Amycolatopsis antarctica]|uniref:helix-turn-helix domain-containing protein n=1 Tax=Amycolatopsis antarctica TaxID=1854586 RepID=UPI00196BA99A|nr:helix-turn-helix transcriptional regulator [Amycolatopsis antarctica]